MAPSVTEQANTCSATARPCAPTWHGPLVVGGSATPRRSRIAVPRPPPGRTGVTPGRPGVVDLGLQAVIAGERRTDGWSIAGRRMA
jgi:hypothetical protein